MPTTARPASAVRPTALGTRTTAALPVGLCGIGLGLILLAVLGPLLSGQVDYRVTETLRNQTVGLDAVSIGLVAPLAILAAVQTARRHVLGPALALGIGAYTAYMLVQYVVGPDYAHLPGNNERLFPLTLALFAAGWMVVLIAWRTIDDGDVRIPPRRARVIGRYVLPLLGLAAFGRYLPALHDWMSASPADAGYLAGPGFAWTIALLDLGVFLPLTAAASVGLVRDETWAPKLLMTVTGWFGLVGTAVAAMAIAMAVNDDPNGSAASAVFLTVLGLTFLALAVVVYWPLVVGGHGAQQGSRRLRAKTSARWRIAVTLITVLVAIGAVFGGVGLLRDPAGLGAKQSWLDGSPFSDYTVPGAVLLIVIGGGMLATAAAALFGAPWAAFAAGSMGVVLLIWGVVETIVIGYQGTPQILLLTTWVLAPALALLVLAGVAIAAARHTT